ncbi:MAG: hemolysin family protein [Lachnospiraceae bacterium]|nr:hemolysin family protein [Lachnospiraceae bacterium]
MDGDPASRLLLNTVVPESNVDLLPWVIVILLLFAAAVLAVTETAMASVKASRIRARADRGDERAKKVIKVLDDFDRAITTILILTNIVHLSAAGIVTVQVTRIWGLGAVTISTVISTLVVFFVGEMLPKSIAKKYSETLSLVMAPTLLLFMAILKPAALLLSKIGQFAGKFTREEPEISVTEDELYDIIEDMTENGSLEEDHGDLISSALSFGNVQVNSIITSRVDVCMIDVAATPEEIIKTIKEVRHSRLPVYEGTVDNIIGILQIRKYIKEYLKDGEKIELRELLDPPYFVHASMKIDDLLAKMSKECINMAIVTDSYGGTRGIVTVEDILEELVGEIWDEDDVVEEPIRRLEENSCVCDDDVHVGDVFEFLDYEDPEENEELENKIIAEWAYENFGTIPKVGDAFKYHDVEVKVFEMDHNRITSLTVTILPSEEKEEGGEEQ